METPTKRRKLPEGLDSDSSLQPQVAISKASRLNGFDTPTVWGEFTPLANEHDACNLGQGFPDWPCPPFAKEAMKRAVDEDFNQYTRSGGHPALVKCWLKCTPHFLILGDQSIL